MNKFIIYSQTNGKIIRVVICPEDSIDMNVTEGEAYLVGDGNDATHYVDLDTHTLFPKKIIDPTVSITGLTAMITNLPIPCTAVIEWIEYDITDGEIDVEFNFAGKYSVEITAENCIKYSVEVTVQ